MTGNVERGRLETLWRIYGPVTAEYVEFAISERPECDNIMLDSTFH